MLETRRLSFLTQAYSISRYKGFLTKFDQIFKFGCDANGVVCQSMSMTMKVKYRQSMTMKVKYRPSSGFLLSRVSRLVRSFLLIPSPLSRSFGWTKREAELARLVSTKSRIWLSHVGLSINCFSWNWERRTCGI
jgi:hypothetical protein